MVLSDAACVLLSLFRKWYCQRVASSRRLSGDVPASNTNLTSWLTHRDEFRRATTCRANRIAPNVPGDCDFAGLTLHGWTGGRRLSEVFSERIALCLSFSTGSRVPLRESGLGVMVLTCKMKVKVNERTSLVYRLPSGWASVASKSAEDPKGRGLRHSFRAVSHCASNVSFLKPSNSVNNPVTVIAKHLQPPPSHENVNSKSAVPLNDAIN